jgi:hypothetical protein|tara:strand:- start:470 stop:589 length:120 start_codon:yes stop_codon:yes gene_type:complete
MTSYSKSVNDLGGYQSAQTVTSVVDGWAGKVVLNWRFMA